jgi:hypothetical protein
MRILFFITVAIVGVALSGCDWLEDNGTHMAECLKAGAKKLSRSNDTELIVRYEPLDGTNQIYDVEFNPDSVLLIGGKREGTTTYHLNYVHVGQRFALMKTNEATFVTLRKVDGRIDVVDVR